jgi:hypothetical protein
MASYTIRYQIAYYRKSGGKTTIDILEKGYGGGVSNLLAEDDPLVIAKEGDVNNIYKPTIGSGVTIKIRATPLSLQHLFTTDPQKYMVKIYDGDSEESSGADNLVWQGFINTGIYTESYSTPICLKSSITIYCNDGMVLLEDIPYTQTVGGLNYTGFDTIGNVMSNVFSKLELEFLTIKTATDLKYETHNNLFTALSINNENYYDESGVAMSCREVLESIFGGVGGLVIFLKGSSIYIIDPICLHTSSTRARSYDTHPTYGANEYVGQNSYFGGYLDISNKDIRWFETGSIKDIVQPFNSINIKYDPYNLTDVIYGFSKANAEGSDTSYSEITNNGITYRRYVDITMKDWDITGIYGFNAIQQIGLATVDDPMYFIEQIPSAAAAYFEYTFPLSNIKQDDNLMLELNFDVYLNTKNVTNIIEPSEAETVINTLYIDDIEIKIGNKWWNGANWQGSAASTRIYIREIDAKTVDIYKHKTWFTRRKYLGTEDQSRIDDRWTTIMLYIPISDAVVVATGLLNGSISIKIPKQMTTFDHADVVPETSPGGYATTTLIHNILIKNIGFIVVDLEKISIGNEGILTNAIIDSAVYIKKSKLDFPLTNGIGPYGVSRGAFSSNEAAIVGVNITGLSRADNVVYKTGELLLQSLMGQYGSPRSILSGSLNVKDYISIIDFYLIKDSTYLGAKAFYIVNGEYHDREERMVVEMIELTDIRETIT